MEPAIRRVNSLAAADGTLPTDMLRQILLRLPADALCHLRLVCRSWRSLTSDPAFAKAHAGRRPLIAALDRRPAPREVHILDAMSDNILRRILVPSRGMGIGYVLADLTTSEPDLVCVSPDHGPSSVLSSVTGVVTALPKDGAGCPVDYPTVLGLVPATGEHKALRFNLEYVNGSTVQLCHVATLGAGGDLRWRAGPRPPVIVEWLRSRYRAVMGGVAYFLLSLCLPLLNSANNMDVYSVASFDLATEEWRPTMAGPLISSLGIGGGPGSNSSKLLYRKHRHDFWLAKLDGFLVMVHHSLGCSMSLWFLVDADKGLWTMKYSIQCEPLCRNHSYDPPHPLAILDDRKIVFRVEVGLLRAYDPSTSMWTDLVRLRGYCDISIHEGSLLHSCVQAIRADPCAPSSIKKDEQCTRGDKRKLGNS